MTHRLIIIMAAAAVLLAPLLTGAETRPERPQGALKLDRASRIEVQNPSGSITIVGGDTDTLHVVATYDDSGDTASVSIDSGGPGGNVEVHPSHRDHGEGGDINLEV